MQWLSAAFRFRFKAGTIPTLLTCAFRNASHLGRGHWMKWLARPSALALFSLTMLAMFPGNHANAEGADRSARGLVEACGSERPDAVNWCAGYLMGVADTLNTFGARSDKGGLCNASYSVEDLGVVFLTWMRANPQLLDIDMLAAVSAAFHHRWPCKTAATTTKPDPNDDSAATGRRIDHLAMILRPAP